MTLDSAIVTPKPSADDQTSLQKSLEVWLPAQSLKPVLLSQWHKVKRDTPDKVLSAASDHLSSDEKSTAWMVPFEVNEPSASQSSGPPGLFDNPELTGSHSHWGDEIPTDAASDRTETGEAKAKTTNDEDLECSTPIPTTSDARNNDAWSRDPSSGSSKRTNSAPFYHPSRDGNEDPTGYGDSSADFWAQ